MLRIILYIFLAIIVYKLVSSFFGGIEEKRPREKLRRPPGKEVGKGWIVDDKAKKGDQENKGA